MGVEDTKQNAILLLGASGGIGASLVEYLSDRTPLILIPTYNKNQPTETSLNWVKYDSLDFDNSRAVIQEISNQYEISMIIDATGAFFASRIQNSTTHKIRDVISTNLIAPLVLAKYSQDFMQVGGKIIFLSSVVGHLELLGSSAYAASKAGLERGVISLSPEFAKTGHGICAIRLGYMNYGMTFKIREKIRVDILRNTRKENFLSISVLGEQILEILNIECSDVNGKIFEIT